MSAVAPVDAALTIGQRIGRYFTLISFIPSLFLVFWIYILIASGSLSGAPALHNIEVSLSHWSVAKVTGLILASFAVALVLHPLQFVTTQLLEGYWGTSPLAITAMKIRIIHHRKRQRELQEQAAWNKDKWRNECLKALGEDPGKDPLEEDQELNVRISSIMESESGDLLMLHSIAEQQASNQQQNYPSDPTRILPTQLGNALRSFEEAAGKQYGLDALVIAPHLQLIVPPRHLEYLIDAREDMDSVIRICVIGLIATALTTGCLLTHGLWLLWVLLPYSISYLAYKGAVSAAQSYGSLIASVIDLDRFLLYDELSVYSPRDTNEERENNGVLMQILGGNYATVRYRQKNAVSDRSTRSARRGRKPGTNS